MRARLAVAVACALAGLPLAPRAADAQQKSVAVYPLKGLRFDFLMPGRATTVPPGDGARAAEVELVGKGRVTLVIELPQALVSPRGDRLPLTFAEGDATVTVTGGGRTSVHDPRRPIDVAIPASQEHAVLRLGGTAAPTPTQAAGEYSGTMTIRIYAPGT